MIEVGHGQRLGRRRALVALCYVWSHFYYSLLIVNLLNLIQWKWFARKCPYLVLVLIFLSWKCQVHAPQAIAIDTAPLGEDYDLEPVTKSRHHLLNHSLTHLHTDDLIGLLSFAAGRWGARLEGWLVSLAESLNQAAVFHKCCTNLRPRIEFALC